MLHFKSIYQVGNLRLRYHLWCLFADQGWHFKLLDLVKALVDLACLVHEVFEFVYIEDVDLLDAFANQRQQVMLLDQAALLLKQL